MDMGGNPPSSIRSALKAACSSSLSLASFCLAALWASDLKWEIVLYMEKQHASSSLLKHSQCNQTFSSFTNT